MQLALIFSALLIGVHGQLSATRDQECKENESFQSCGTACEPSCENQNPSFCTIQCVIGCQCDKGFYRNSENKCVSQSDCNAAPSSSPIPLILPAPSTNLTCDTNEEANECHNSCTERKCPSKFAPLVNCLMACQNGCSCKTGHMRNMKGQCVKEADCPSIGNSTEDQCNLIDCQSGTKCMVLDDVPTCIPDFLTLPGNETVITPCATIKCSSGSECQERETNCTVPPCERYGECVNTTLIGNGGCVSLLCGPDEICEEALIKCGEEPCPRHGRCVPGPSQNITLSGCDSITCPVGETCEEADIQCVMAPCTKAVSCVPIDTSLNSTARQGCDVVDCRPDEICVEQVVQCITAPCPIQVECVSVIHINGTEPDDNTTGTTCGANQTLSTCMNTCIEPKCNGMEKSMVCTKHCGSGCACADGYLRSNDGECYKPADCPFEPMCGPDEEYRCEKCAGTCKNPEPNCPAPHNKTCTKKCICAPGFVKKNGKCVTLASCPDHVHQNITCLGTQEYTDCLPKCHQMCSGINDCDTNVSATVCKPGCVCRHNYKLDSYGECVHNRHCYKSTECGENEEWSKCVSDDNICGLVTIQRAPLRDRCFSGCVCSPGFARNANRTCIDETEC